ARHRRPARGRARGRRLRPGRRLPRRRPAPPSTAVAPRHARLRVAPLPPPLQSPRPARPRTLPRPARRLALLAEARPAADGEAVLDARLRGHAGGPGAGRLRPAL